MPTALQNITELLQRGLLEECGVIQSTGGRKAKKICVRAQAGKTIGIDIALHHIELVVTNLKGTVLCQKQLSMVFRDEPSWYQQLREQLMRFLRKISRIRHKFSAAASRFPALWMKRQGRFHAPMSFLCKMSVWIGLKNIFRFLLSWANDANCAACRTVSDTLRLCLSLPQ